MKEKCPTMPVPAGGKKYYGLSRNGAIRSRSSGQRLGLVKVDRRFIRDDEPIRFARNKGVAMSVQDKLIGQDAEPPRGRMSASKAAHDTLKLSPSPKSPRC